jgi:hypothetical protein
VHNVLATLKADTIGVYASVAVNVYLGVGDHYLFSCADDYNADVSALSDVTDFCTEIPTLQNVYSPHDSISIVWQPMYCTGDASSGTVFDDNCVPDGVYPVIH